MLNGGALSEKKNKIRGYPGSRRPEFVQLNVPPTTDIPKLVGYFPSSKEECNKTEGGKHPRNNEMSRKVLHLFMCRSQADIPTAGDSETHESWEIRNKAKIQLRPVEL